MIINNMIEKLQNEINKNFQNIYFKTINVEDIVFEDRVRMNCFYCGKYNKNWKCPPKIPALDYKKVFSEYENIAMVYLKMPFNEESYSDIRNESSRILHKALLSSEKLLWNNNYSMAISFIGGSCKLCKNGCGLNECNNPYMARTPIEATGVNVVKTAEKYGVSVVFPPKENLLRIGLLLW